MNIKQIFISNLNLFLLMLVIFTLLISKPSFAQNEASSESAQNVKYESINPDSFFYPFKRLWEKIGFNLSFSEDQKREYMQKLLDTRFKELVYVAKEKKYSEFEQASSRYNTLIGEYIQKYSDKKKAVEESAGSYEKILGELKKQYESDYAYWSFLKSSQETTQNLESN